MIHQRVIFEMKLMRTVLPWMVILTLCVLPGCKGKKATSDKARGAGSGTALVADGKAAAHTWLPPNRSGSKFVIDSVRSYDKETIYELLNGGADAFIDAGLVSLLHVRIKDAAGKFTACEVQVMDLGSPGSARALLAKEKPTGGRPVKLGDRAFATKGTVLFVKGRFLVQVGVQPMGKLTWAPAAEIARRVIATPKARW
jgi:hypothetical protein